MINESNVAASMVGRVVVALIVSTFIAAGVAYTTFNTVAPLYLGGFSFVLLASVWVRPAFYALIGETFSKVGLVSLTVGLIGSEWYYGVTGLSVYLAIVLFGIVAMLCVFQRELNRLAFDFGL